MGTVNALLDAGLSIIPIKDKRPTVNWKEYQTRKPEIGELTYNGSLGAICGVVSKGLEAIDVDVKNDTTGTLVDRLQTAIEEQCPDLLLKLTIQKTPSGGLHLIYRCREIEGNQILAKSKENLVLIETRGEGGYIAIEPTPNYKILHNDLLNVNEISPDERASLLDSCRSLNENFKIINPPKSDGIAPWEAYNEKADLEALLEKHGWAKVYSRDENTYYRRPGKNDGISACFNGQTFYCFTSSTQFAPSSGYSPSAVYTYLECKGDFKEAARRLYSEGYGERYAISKTELPKFDTSHWRSLQVVCEPPEETPLLTIGKAPIATAGNYSLVIGKKKSRKTLFITWLVSQYKGNSENEVLLFDTEQGTRHVWKVMDRIKRLTGFNVGTFYLRGKSPAERKAIIETVVKEYATRPKIVIIDGIRDLLSNINDPDQVSELLTWLEKITLENGLHVVNVLHQNKTDNNARGHLGSELLNKSEITIELERDEKADCTIVKCESSRDIPFDAFAFRHNAEGLPELVDIPTAGKVLTEIDKRERLQFVFNDLGDQLNYSTLTEGIKLQFGVGLNKAKGLIAEFNRSGWIVKNGIERSKDVVYKLGF